MGECRTRVTLCTGNERCKPLQSSPESCNGLDDDCDGVADQGLGLAPQAVYDLRTTELSTGACSVCNWAFGNATWQAEDGIHALFRLGFNGQEPQPNIVLGGLTPELDAIPPRTLFQSNVTQGFQIAVGVERVGVAACARYGVQDRPSVFWLDTAGSPLGEPEPLTADRSVWCNQAPPGAVFTGERFLFAWYENGPLMLSVRDREGVETSQGVLVDGGSATLPPRFGVSGDRVLAVALRSSSRGGQYLVLDPEGRVLSGPTLFGPEDLDLRDANVSPTRDGWLVVVVDGRTLGYYVGRVSREGELEDTMRFVELGGYMNAIDLAPIPAGGHLLVGSFGYGDSSNRFARRLDDQGNLVDEWTSEGGMGEYFHDPSLVINDRESRVVFSEACDDYQPNAVRIMQLGCLNHQDRKRSR